MKNPILIIFILCLSNLVIASPPLQQLKPTAPVSNTSVEKSNQKVVPTKEKTTKTRKSRNLKKQWAKRKKSRLVYILVTLLIIGLSISTLSSLLALFIALAFLGLPVPIAIILLIAAAVAVIGLTIWLIKKVLKGIKYKKRSDKRSL